MDLDALGNLGDFISGIGVLATLIYLAVQIRQNTGELRNSTIQTLLDRSIEMFSGTIASEIPEIQHKELVGEELSGPEEIRLRMFVRRNFQLFEQVYLQSRQGRVTDDIMQAYERRIAAHFASPRWSQNWAALKPLYTAAFSDYVDGLARGQH
jgi:hypothetical protein